MARTTTMVYDAAGNLVSQTSGLSSNNQLVVVSNFVYDDFQERTQIIEAVGQANLQRTTYVTYDAQGNTLTVATPQGYDLDGNGQPVSNPLHVTTRTAYDALNRRTSVTEALGTSLQRTSYFSYDSANNLLTQTDPASVTTSYAYDALNRATAVTQDAGGSLQRTTRTSYDAAGNVLSTTDALGDTTSIVYDRLNRKVTSTDPDDKVTTFVYDAANNLLRLTDPDNNTTAYQYDALNRRIEMTDPLGHTATFIYDAAGNLRFSTDRLGRERIFTYDTLQRETGENWVNADGSNANMLAYSYDSQGHQRTAAEFHSLYTLTYDALGRQTSQQGPFGQVLTYGYDAANNRTSVQDSQGGLTTSTYDVLNRLTERLFVGNGQTSRIDQGWTNRDQLASETDSTDAAGNNVVSRTTYTYDDLRRTSSIAVSGSRTLEHFSYQYDAGDRLTLESRTAYDSDGSTKPSFTYSTTFSYDNDGQLTSDGTASYTYDADGNRVNGSTTIGPNNQLLGDATATYTYDEEGNLSRKVIKDDGSRWDYTYDHQNHLLSATHTSSSGTVLAQVSFQYDVFGHRLEESSSSGGTTTVTHFAYDGGNVWADLDGNNGNALQVRYVRGNAPDQLFARWDVSHGVLWYVTDRLNSVVDLLNSSGAVVDRYRYQGFDLLFPDTITVADRYQYTSREFDVTLGMQYNRDRWLDPKTGRWTSQDPLGFSAGDTNLYRYAGNSPTNASDPSGDFLFTAIGAVVGGAIGAVAAGISSGEWDWEHLAAGAASGAMVGAAIGLTVDTGGAAGVLIGGALLGAGMGAASGSGAFQAGGQVSWSGFGTGAAIGGVAGLAGGAAGMAAGAALGAGMLGMVGAGAISGLAGNAASQGMSMALGVQREWSWSQFAASGLGGALGGAVAGGLTRGLTNSNGQVLCNVTRGQWLTRQAVAGGLGGAAGDAVDQVRGLLTGEQRAWDFGRTFQSTALGVGQGLAAGYGQWRYNRACFAAGTPLLWEHGSKAIEQFLPGDRVWARDENDSEGPLQLKVVEEVFVRLGQILHLHVQGQAIRTTAEHPFYVYNKGWVSAGELQIGDLLSSHNGQWLAVEDLLDTGEYETVYNLRVADFHTYFVGCQEWGWSIWAHNLKCGGEGGRDGTRLLEDGFQEIDPTLKTDMIRNRPGVAHGGEELPGLTPGQYWLDKETGSVGLIPQEVASQLRGRSFTDWRNFREQFWKAVAAVPELFAQFKPDNQARILRGAAPRAPKPGHSGNRITFELDHMDPLLLTGPNGLYDLSNIMVAPARVNLSFESFK